MALIISVFAKIHYKLTLSLHCTQVTCFLGENVGGSEKNRLITGADVRTGDLLPSLSALEALRNALYKFKTYLLTYLLYLLHACA